LDSANDQKILGYFIEEAKEHLETLEHGILDLGNLVNNHEQMNEMFRAAHSVKAGAAMLGYSSIQLLPNYKPILTIFSARENLL